MIPLPQITVAAPCHESWDAMSGDETRRHCEVCQKDVYNLSAMTTQEAQALLAAKGEKLCVRFNKRADGTPVTRQFPRPQIRMRRSVAFGWLVSLIVAGIVGIGTGAFAVRQASTKPASSVATIKKPAHRNLSVGPDPFQIPHTRQASPKPKPLGVPSVEPPNIDQFTVMGFIGPASRPHPAEGSMAVDSNGGLPGSSQLGSSQPDQQIANP